MMWFVDISPVQWLWVYNNVALYRLSVDSSYTTYSLWPSSIQYHSTTERLLSTQNSKTTTPLSILVQAKTRHTCILGYAVPIMIDARSIQNEVSMDSLSLSRRIPSYCLQLCQLDFLPRLALSVISSVDATQQLLKELLTQKSTRQEMDVRRFRVTIVVAENQ
jgi:hypothetical protein